VFWILLLIAACAPPPLRQDWHPEQGFEILLHRSAEQLRRLEDLTAEASVTVRRGDAREQGTALIQLRNPDLFRIEVRGPFYSHILTVLLQKDTLMVHGPAAGGSWKGTVRGSLLPFLTGVDLRAYDLRHALLGVVAPGRVDPAKKVEYPRADRAIVPLVGEGAERRIWVDLFSGFVVREELDTGAGDGLLSRRLGDYRRVGDLYLPTRVEIHQQETTIVLDYRHYALNRGIAAKRFFDDLPLERMRRVD